MNVEREGVQRESVGDGAREVLEERRGRKGEGVAHCCCCRLGASDAAGW